MPSKVYCLTRAWLQTKETFSAGTRLKVIQGPVQRERWRWITFVINATKQTGAPKKGK